MVTACDLPVRHPRRISPVLAGVLAAAGIVVVMTSCSNVTPLGPGSAQLPSARQLGSPIVVQAMRVQPPTASGTCPARWVAVWMPAGAGPIAVTTAVPAGPPTPVPVGSAQHIPAGTGASAPPAPPAQAPPPGGSVTEFVGGHSGFRICYRPVGAQVTIKSAGVSSVLTIPPPPGQANGPAQYGFLVAVPGADVAAVTGAIRHAYDTGSAVGISVAGKLWQTSMVAKPFAGQQLQISLLSRTQAVQLHHLLVQTG